MKKRITIQLDEKSYASLMQISILTKRNIVLQEAIELYKIRGDLKSKLHKIYSLVELTRVHIDSIDSDLMVTREATIENSSYTGFISFSIELVRTTDRLQTKILSLLYDTINLLNNDKQ